MESFLTQECIVNGSTATVPAGTDYSCEYGGVIPYVAIVFFFLYFFTFVFGFINRLTDKLL